MINSDILLIFICFMLLFIWIYVRWIYLILMYPKEHENILTMPINKYGENIGDAIQGQIIRGQRGIE